MESLWNDSPSPERRKSETSSDVKPNSSAETNSSEPRATVMSPGVTAMEYGLTSAASVVGKKSAFIP